jgi:hypothetical protein
MMRVLVVGLRARGARPRLRIQPLHEAGGLRDADDKVGSAVQVERMRDRANSALDDLWSVGEIDCVDARLGLGEGCTPRAVRLVLAHAQ